MKLHARIDEHGNPQLTDNQRAFLLKQGKFVLIEPDNAPSTELRGFFHGAIIPFVYYQHPHSGWATFDDCYRAVMIEFRPLRTRTLKSGWCVEGDSSSGKSKAWFQRLVDDVLAWMGEQAMELPDAESWKSFRDSAPTPDQAYPPIERLKAGYAAARQQPVWRM